MTLRESARMALRSVRANLLRSSLAMLGIIIGIAAVIAMVAIGAGAQARVADQIRSLGANLILVQGGASSQGGVRLGTGSRQTLTEEDAAAIARGVPSALVVAPAVIGNAHIVRGKANWATLVGGITPPYLTARDWRVEQGRAFTMEELQSAAKVVLLGRTVVERLFAGEDPVGQLVRIANVPFTIVGVLSAKGQDAFSGRDQDDIAMVPLSTAKLRVLGTQGRASRRTVDFILVKAASSDALAPIQAQIRDLLRQRHRLAAQAEDDFQLREPTAAMAAQADASRSLTVLLAAIASVSLVVGGIGIMNVMLVSVTERTREIGLRQALGARARDVRDQFVIEAVILCLCGGLVGVTLGTMSAIAVAELGGWPVLISPATLLLSVACAASIGVFFGYYPARKAAQLDPVQALRFE